MLTERFRVACDHAHDAHGTVLERSLAQFVAELRAVMPALIIGSALAGAVQVIVPRSALVAIGSNPVLSIVAMIILAVTVSLCSNVDSFFALSFASTFTTGSLVAFLLVGPVVDIKMIALLRTTFTARVIVVISAVVVLAAFSVGAVMNLVV
jgi:uncharacterized membrane protein YraQ (UPF0718 family)